MPPTRATSKPRGSCVCPWRSRWHTSSCWWLPGIRVAHLALLSEAGHNLSDFVRDVAVVGRGLSPGAAAERAEDLSATLAPAFWPRSSTGWRWSSSRSASGTRPFAASAPVEVQPEADDLGSRGGRGDERRHCAAPVRGHRDINIRSALLHEIGDTLSTAAVIVGRRGDTLTGQAWIDPALSVVSA